MVKQSLSGIVKGVRLAMKKHSPEILTGIGIAGMITTTILAVRATPKALRLIEQAEVQKSKNLGEGSESTDGELTKTEVIKTVWKCYIPSAITAVMSVTCLVGASSANVRRHAALATAYALSESALKDYQEKVIETIGEKKEQSVRDAIAKDKIDKNPVSNSEVIITRKGDTLCYDTLSGRYFKTDIDRLKRAAIELSRQMLGDMYVSLNDFYDEIELRHTKMGDDLGWHIDDGIIDLRFSSHLADDETPCLVMGYEVAPRYDYRRR